MQTSFVKVSTLLCATAFVVSACSTNERPAHGMIETPATLALAAPPAKRELHFPLKSLSYEDAQAIMDSEPGLFASASALAAQRPAAHREIAELALDSMDANGKVEDSSVMRFQPLPGGLDFTRHIAAASANNTAFEETMIDVYGIADVLHHLSRMVLGAQSSITGPNQLRLLRGKLFSLDSPFSFETRTSGSNPIVMNCMPAETLLAQRVHPSLFEHAAYFNCKSTSPDVTVHLVYLEDTARYVPLEIRDGNDMQSRFKISKVTYRE